MAAFPVEEKTGDPVQVYLIDVCTLPVNIAGQPGLSAPCGFVASESHPPLPVGMQLIGPHLSEATLLRISHGYEQATEWHRHRPPL